ncbi:transposase [Paenibacillus sinopodophylli]|uniref:transposase n=1 Tax=Paenibacillus sinopodophylli TaxID=1837342 RepID=UPI00110D06AA|nr:transposase [Paenibacillus sinopodophylli]
MNDEEFIKDIYQLIVRDNLEIYRNIFTKTDITTITDPYWKRAMQLFEELPEENKEILLNIIEQVQVDTTSTLLGILDGVISLRDLEIELKLTTKGQEAVLNGDLQDKFLEFDEENR